MKYKILGIDPGSNATGYGVIEEKASDYIHVASGTIIPPKSASFPQKLLYIHENLLQVTRSFEPTHLAIEESFVSKNARSSLKLGQARGVILLMAAQLKLPIFEYAPNQVKIAITGFGHASKEQIQSLVMRRLKIDRSEKLDTSDALAIALCHSQCRVLSSKC